MKFAGFDWDAGNIGKCQQHGVSIEEIEAIFEVPLGLLFDPVHSSTEDRYKVVGYNKKGRMIVVAFTTRNRLVRPISARYMHRKETHYYEEVLPRP